MKHADQVVYVYGVVSAADPPPAAVAGAGGGERPVRRIDCAGLGALVSDVEREPVARAAAIRAHWRVLDEVASRSTVLPLRFGTVMADDTLVRDELLAPNRARLSAALARLAGKVQLTVRGFYDEDRLLAEIVRDVAPVRRLRERVQRLPAAAAYYERIQLGELVAAEIERRRERDTELVLARLAKRAIAAKAETPTTQGTAVAAAFLVDRERVDDFSAAVTRLVEEVGGRMRIRYVGPLPAYSFADDEPQEVAWAS